MSDVWITGKLLIPRIVLELQPYLSKSNTPQASNHWSAIRELVSSPKHKAVLKLAKSKTVHKDEHEHFTVSPLIEYLFLINPFTGAGLEKTSAGNTELCFDCDEDLVVYEPHEQEPLSRLSFPLIKLIIPSERTQLLELLAEAGMPVDLMAVMPAVMTQGDTECIHWFFDNADEEAKKAYLKSTSEQYYFYVTFGAKRYSAEIITWLINRWAENQITPDDEIINHVYTLATGLKGQRESLLRLLLDNDYRPTGVVFLDADSLEDEQLIKLLPLFKDTLSRLVDTKPLEKLLISLIQKKFFGSAGWLINLIKQSRVGFSDIDAIFYVYKATLDNDTSQLAFLKQQGFSMTPAMPCNTSPLHNAITYKNKEALVWLVNNGSDVNYKDDNNRTPLELAELLNAADFFKILKP